MTHMHLPSKITADQAQWLARITEQGRVQSQLTGLRYELRTIMGDAQAIPWMSQNLFNRDLSDAEMIERLEEKIRVEKINAMTPEQFAEFVAEQDRRERDWHNQSIDELPY
jgi:hypothetical protein